MISITDNRIEYSGTIILAILFLLFFAVSHQNPARSDNSLPVQYHLSIMDTPAVSSENIPQLTCTKNIKELLNASNHESEYSALRIESDNRLINQRIAFLHKVELTIKPAPLRFYFHPQSFSSADFPVSS